MSSNEAAHFVLSIAVPDDGDVLLFHRVGSANRFEAVRPTVMVTTAVDVGEIFADFSRVQPSDMQQSNEDRSVRHVANAPKYPSLAKQSISIVGHLFI